MARMRRAEPSREGRTHRGDDRSKEEADEMQEQRSACGEESEGASECEDGSAPQGRDLPCGLVLRLRIQKLVDSQLAI